MNVLTLLSLAVSLTTVNTPVPAPGNPTPETANTFAPTAEPSFGFLSGPMPPVYFCGESVPLHEAVVARRLMSALVRSTTHNWALYRLQQRAARFFPIIEPILTRHGIPLDFKYLPLVESALKANAVSSAGAVGYWQFMPATACELGLKINGPTDERQNLIKSTNAACRYLRYLYNRLGSWTLAAAAYNNGIGALLSNIRRQHQRDYYYLRLNAETGKYLYRILAFKELFSNYHAYPSIIPDQMMACLSRSPAPQPTADDDLDVLLPTTLLDEATRTALNTPSLEGPVAGHTVELPLPNAADVFRGGIKARLTESTGLVRGQVWTFHLTRDGMTDGKTVDEGDILYAVVEDIDPKTNRLYLRADRLYSATEKHTYSLALAAVDASTGRIGISLSDVYQVKAGWILTWKAL